MKRCPRCNIVYADHTQFCIHDGAALVNTPGADPVLGTLIAGTYRIRNRLDSGGFGSVYKASHIRLPITVAIKILGAAHALYEEMVSRFRMEAQAEAMFDHPNIVHVIDHGQQEGIGYYIVMEFLVGRDLGRRLAEEPPLDITQIGVVLTQTMAALQAAHARGLVHRDVKAENLFLVDDAQRPEGFHVKLLDFGLARLKSDAGWEVVVAERRHKTRASRAFGSPGTMAPEVAARGTVDERSDIYSLGAVLYEMLTGEMLFQTEDVQTWLRRILEAQPPPPSARPRGRWVPQALDALVAHMLAKDPARRPQSIPEVRQAVESIWPEVEAAWSREFFVNHRRPSDNLDRWGDLPSLARQPLTAEQTPTVLIVDDDRTIRVILHAIIGSIGFRSEGCENAEQAFAWFASHPAPTAVLIDLLMPDIGGVDMAQVLRAHDYDGLVVICSAMDATEFANAVPAVANTGYLDKRLDLHKLPAMLRASMQQLPRQ